METAENNSIVFDPGTASEKQKRFFLARAPFIAYGGAKGGGKTWAVRVKAVGGAICNPGLRVLIMRRTYPELEENHIGPLLRMVPPEIGSYMATTRRTTFFNGSTIKFGHWAGELSELEYQGQEFDWIFIDEATQFTERAFNYLKGCLRGVSPYQKRMYLTCNPGGVGHAWVKRLFIDRDYRRSENPEENEAPEDYVFIPATVEDNVFLLKSSPHYLKMLSQMPENVRRAYRYGDWDALGGSYFSELRRDTHTFAPMRIPRHWRRYRAMDYGLDMLAVLWIAVDGEGRSWVYREWTQPRLIVRQAAAGILERTLPGEEVEATFAPPDLWSTQKDTGRTMEEIFRSGGVPLTRADNSRVQGHMLIKDMLALRPDGRPGLMISTDCKRLLADMTAIQADEENPGDAAKTPHEVTHTVDALRYYCVSRVAPAEEPRTEAEEAAADPFWGGEPSGEYLMY